MLSTSIEVKKSKYARILADVWLGEELFAEAGVTPEPQHERDAHDEHSANDDQWDEEADVRLLRDTLLQPPT